VLDKRITMEVRVVSKAFTRSISSPPSRIFDLDKPNMQRADERTRTAHLLITS
jgi:hypothetical protein